MALLRSMPLLQVADVRRSVAFYERLGFFCGGPWTHDGEATFAIVQRGEVTLGLQRLAGADSTSNTHWAAYLYTDDAQALHAEFAAAGLEPSELRRNTDYACDDFEIRDPDGHLIAFGQDRADEHGPGLGPNRGKG